MLKVNTTNKMGMGEVRKEGIQGLQLSLQSFRIPRDDDVFLSSDNMKLFDHDYQHKQTHNRNLSLEINPSRNVHLLILYECNQ